VDTENSIVRWTLGLCSTEAVLLQRASVVICT